MGNQTAKKPEKPKFKYWIVSILVLIISLLVILGWNIFSVSNELTCAQDNNCVIAIQATTCCSCPKAVNQEVIGRKDWELYEFGKDYSSQQAKSCGEAVVCKPCELSATSICQNSQCRLIQDIPDIISQELEKGWYWGQQYQKKPGTPNEWIFNEAGRSSCWHKPQVNCF